MTDRERSVLFVSSRDFASPLGCTTVHYLVAGMAKNHDVHAVCRKRPSERNGDTPPADATVHELNTGEIPILSGVLFALLSSLYVVALSARHQYDVVYAFQNELVQGRLATATGTERFAANLQSVPVRQGLDFMDLKSGDPDIRERISMTLYRAYAAVVGYTLRSADIVFCLTDGIREVTENTYGVDLSAAHVFGMGIDTAAFAPPDPPGTRTDDAAEGCPTPGEPWTVTYVGSIGETRHLDHVIEAIAATDYDVEFRVAGNGPDDYVATLRERAAELGVADAVTWLGLVPHDEVPALLHETDVSVSPLADIESYRISFPAKLLEYLAAGTVVVATDLLPHRRLIEDGTNGFLAETGPHGVRGALERCIERESDHDAIRRAARETALAYDWDAIVARHEATMFPETSVDEADKPPAKADSSAGRSAGRSVGGGGRR